MSLCFLSLGRNSVSHFKGTALKHTGEKRHDSMEVVCPQGTDCTAKLDKRIWVPTCCFGIWGV